MQKEVGARVGFPSPPTPRPGTPFGRSGSKTHKAGMCVFFGFFALAFRELDFDFDDNDDDDDDGADVGRFLKKSVRA